MKTLIVLSALAAILFPSFAFCQNGLSVPDNAQEAKDLGNRALDAMKSKGISAINDAWKNEVLPLWQKIYEWVKINLWENALGRWLKNIWHSTLRILKLEVEERKPGIEERVQTETGALKDEAPKVGKTLWQKFQDIIR
jgi:hypothetical protein